MPSADLTHPLAQLCTSPAISVALPRSRSTNNPHRRRHARLSSAGSPSITPTMSSPASSIAKDGPPPATSASPPGIVGSLRRYRKIPRARVAEPATEAPLLNVRQAAKASSASPHPPSCAGLRRLHPWRADHPRRALADPTQRRAQPSLRRRGSQWLPAHARGHPPARRLAPDRVATCQARSADRRPRPPRPAKRPLHQSTRTTARSLRTPRMNQEGSVSPHRRSCGCRHRAPSSRAGS